MRLRAMTRAASSVFTFTFCLLPFAFCLHVAFTSVVWFAEEALAVALYPVFEVCGGLLKLVGVDEAAAQRLEEGARAHVVGELFVSLVRRAFGGGDEELLVESREPALHAAQAESALARNRPVREPEREVLQGFGLELREQRPLERVFERRVDHVRAVFEHGRDEAEESRLGVVLVYEAVCGLRLDRAEYLANLVDVNLVGELSPEDDSRGWELAPHGARGLHAGEPRHLYVQDAQLGPRLQCERDGLLAVGGFNH